MSEGRPFQGRIRFFRPETSSGLAVVDVPTEVAAELGGLRQMRVRAIVNGQPFASNTMPAGRGRLALSLSRHILAVTGLAVGDDAQFDIQRLP
jgi:hypothetical protein